jgi:hypothetical protein
MAENEDNSDRGGYIPPILLSQEPKDNEEEAEN